MPLSLADHFALIETEYAEALAHPLSARQAMLVAVLLDKYADRLFYARRDTAPEKLFYAEDVLAFRTRLAAAMPALDSVFALCALAPDGPRLVTRTVAVPLPDYPSLPLADFMVSLYNGNTVQRVLLVGAGDGRLALEVIGEAVAGLQEFGTSG
jgi:hypothetical protein